MRARLVVPAAAILLVVAVFLSGHPGRRGAGPRRPNVQTALGMLDRMASQPSTVAGTLGRQDALGRILTYRLSHEAGAEFRREDGATMRVGMTCEATLVVRTLAMRGSDVIEGYAMQAVRLDAEASGAQVPAEALRRQAQHLEHEVLVRISPRGEVLEISFPPEVEPSDRNVWRGILAAMRIVLPESPASSWTVREEDALGAYDAAYEAAEVGGAMQIRKTKSYRPGALPQEHDGTFLATWSRTAGVLAAIESRETLHGRGATRGPSVAMSQSLSLSLYDARMCGTDARTEREADARFARQERGNGFSLERVPCEDVSGGAPIGVDEACEGLRTLVAEGRLEGTERILQGLAAELARSDDAVRRAEDAIRDAGLGTIEVAAAVVSALGRAGTKEAEGALCRIADDRTLPHALRASSILALSLVTSPSRDGVETLERHALRANEPQDPLALQSIEALGILAATRARQGDCAEASRLAGLLVEAYPRYDDIGWKTAVLLGLGNAGDPSALGLIVGAREDPREQVRSVAVFALRRMPSERVAPFLEQAALRDGTPAVRVAALQALAAQPTQASDDVAARSLVSDEDVGVRLQAVRYLVGAAVRPKEVRRAALEAAARSDHSDEVRRRAAEGLASLEAEE